MPCLQIKTIIEHRRDDVKEFTRMAVNTAKTFELISRNAANPCRSKLGHQSNRNSQHTKSLIINPYLFVE
jgi:hypothetical protein